LFACVCDKAAMLHIADQRPAGGGELFKGGNDGDRAGVQFGAGDTAAR
jgi:hypothetical protein